MLFAGAVLLLSLAFADAARPRPNILKRVNPSYTPLTDTSLAALATLTDLDTVLDFSNPSSALSRLLIPRPAGSKNLTSLQALVSQHFTNLNWHVEQDRFTSSTPYGPKEFTNLIFTHDPGASRRLLLAAHLDSKFFPNPPDDQFVGATDSAAPCAMLLDVAAALTPWLDTRRDRVASEGGEVGGEGDGQRETLQIVFFDGEEAFKDWTSTDSIYGARHLVEKWSQPLHPPSPTAPKSSSTLSRISHLILLDLLGAPNPVIRSFYSSTGWFFDEFTHAELRLGAAGLLWSGLEGDEYTATREKLGVRERSFFVPRKSGAASFSGGIEDDHVPFVKNGVPVVHLISVPFPRVWHTIQDDVTALDLPTIKAWSLIVRLTVAEYLGLDPSINTPEEEDPDAGGDEDEEGTGAGATASPPASAATPDRRKRSESELSSIEWDSEGSCERAP